MYTQHEISEMVERFLAEIRLPEEPAKLYRPIEYTMDEGGKRLRPMLLVAACNLFSDDVLGALPAASAVEMFHNFTLLHDDIMDNASIRRGKESVFRKWGTNRAILSGDAMLIFSYMMLGNTATEQLPQVLREFNLLALEVCEGQQYDVDFEESDKVTVDDYIHMVSLKTASLIARSMNLGATLGGASQADSEALYEFGMNLGIAFQIQDDLLDSYGSRESFGKNIGGDILEGKKTFLMLHAINAGCAPDIRNVLDDSALDDAAKIDSVKAIFDRADVRPRTEEAIGRYTSLALDALARVSVPEQRKATIKDITASLLGRQK